MVTGPSKPSGNGQIKTAPLFSRKLRAWEKTMKPILAKFHPLMARQLRFALQESREQIAISMNSAIVSTLNRVIGSDKKAEQELAAIKEGPGQLETINNCLERYGYRFVLDQTKQPAKLSLEEAPSQLAVSALEEFRRSSSEAKSKQVLETAYALSKSHYDQVVEILKYESVNPCLDNWEFLDGAARFFWREGSREEERDFENYIPAALRLLPVFQERFPLRLLTSQQKQLTYTGLNRVRLNIVRSYIAIDDLRKAKIALQDISFNTMQDEDQLAEYLEACLMVYVNLSNNDSLIRLYKQILANRTTPPQAIPHCKYFLAKAVIYSTLNNSASPTKEAAETIIDKYLGIKDDPIVSNRYSFPPFLLIWIYLHAGNIEAARNIFDAEKNNLWGGDIKSQLSDAALEACLLEKEGADQHARTKALEVIEILRGDSNSLEAQHLRGLKALLAAMQRITAPLAAPLPIIQPKVVEPVKVENELPASIDKIVFRDGFDHYDEVFSKDRRRAIEEKLEQSIGNSREVIAGYNFHTLIYGENNVLEGKDEASVAAEKLGITQIIIANSNLEIIIQLNNGTTVKGRLNEELELELAGVRGPNELRLAGRLILAAILEKLVEMVYEEPADPTVAAALTATPTLRSGQANTPELPVKPAPPQLSPEQLFQQNNIIALDHLRRKVAKLGIDISDLDAEVIPQIFDLIELIETRRDQTEDPDCFQVIPASSDPLEKAIPLVRIYGPVNGRTVLATAGVTKESLKGFGLVGQGPSALLSVVEFELDQEEKLVAVIDRNGELIIPGDGQKDELLDLLQRTALESLARVVVPEIREIQRIANLPQQIKKEEMERTRTEEEDPIYDESHQRLKTLPALVILDKDNSLNGVSKALGTLIRQLKQKEIKEKGAISLPLFTKQGNIYLPFPPDPQKRKELFEKLSPEEIFIQERWGYSYRLPLGAKRTSPDTRHLLPLSINPKLSQAARQNPVAVDLKTRAYLYGVLEYTALDGKKIYLAHPKTSVIPETALPGVPRQAPKYHEETWDNIPVRVYHTVPEESVARLLVKPEVDAAIDAWRQGQFPELGFASPPRRKMLAGAKLTDQYFLIMPTLRGFNQGRFAPLSDYKIDPKSEEETI